MSAFSSRPLPHSADAERAVLGSCLMDAGCHGRAKLMLVAESFYLAGHQIIWRHLEGKAGDMIAVTQSLLDADKLAECGGAAYLADCLAAAQPYLIDDHIAIVREKLTRRELLAAAVRLTEQAYDTNHETEPLANTAARVFTAISQASVSKSAQSLRPLADSSAAYADWCDRRDEVAVNLGKWLPTLRYGCGALAGGEMVVIVADTGVGKTACCQNLSLAVAPLKTALFELELPETLTYPRYLQLLHGLSISQVYHAHREGKADELRNDTRLKHIWLDSTSGLSVAEIERRVMAHNAQHEANPFRVVIVDYFQLLRGEGKTRYERFSNEAEAIKVAAKRTNAVWIVISQISRPEDAQGYQPGLHDAKETGSIENSAGLVLGIWRDEVDAQTLYLKVLKNTKGQSGAKLTCNFHGETLRITERAA